MTFSIQSVPELSYQQIFEASAIHLLIQNWKSMDYGRSRYHSPNGRKCAAGIFISDEEHSLSFENQLWVTVAKRKRELCGNDSLIAQLQKVHDHHEVIDWKNELLKVARKFDLTTDFMQQM